MPSITTEPVMPRRKPKSALPFDQLPDDAQVREDMVLQVWPVGRTTLQRQIERGEFPAPNKIGPRIRSWTVGRVRRRLASADDAEQP